MKTLLHPKGDTALNDQYTGPDTQFTVDIDRYEIRLHDGETPGGHRILNLAQLMLLFMSKDSEFGDVAFNEGERGYLVRIGHRQYTLREIEGGDGIEIEEGQAEGGNTVISIDEDWLATFLSTLAFNAINFVSVDGDGDAFTFEEEDWPNEDGSVIGVRFLESANDSATLSVNGDDPVPLRLSDASRNVGGTLTAGTRGIILRQGNGYYVIGMQGATQVGINPISGLDAVNVQQALEEIAQRLAEGAESSPGDLDGLLDFGEVEGDWDANIAPAPGIPGAVSGAITHTNVDIEDGEARGFITRYVINRGQPGQAGIPAEYGIDFVIIAKIEGVYYEGTHTSNPSASLQDGIYESGPIKISGYNRLGSTFAFSQGVSTFIHFPSQKAQPW